MSATTETPATPQTLTLRTMSRRAALARLGFASTVVYMAPVLATLSDARASGSSYGAGSDPLRRGSASVVESSAIDGSGPSA